MTRAHPSVLDQTVTTSPVTTVAARLAVYSDTQGNLGNTASLTSAQKIDALNDLGAASSVNASFTGSMRVATGGSDFTITGGSTPFTPDRAFFTIYNDDVRDFTLRVTSTWEGGTGDPFNNNDSILSEVRNRVLSDSANQTWAYSGANAYNSIPVGVTDSGMRVGVLGWATSVNIAGFTHAGRLNAQYGVWGRAGFQGGGDFQSPSTARLNVAVGVRGEIATDSPNARMDRAYAGYFESVCTNGQIDDNVAVYARAAGATTTNYSFFGEGGTMLNRGSIVSASAGIPNGSSSNLENGVLLNPVGNFFVARTGTDSKFSLQSFPGANSSAILAAFLWNSAVTGTITHTSTTTTYATSSDYRLPWKEGKVELENSGDFIDSLKPYYFPNAGKAGFIAHEFAETSPVSVTGNKDAVDENGEPVYQQMQASTDDVIAHLVAELQSLRKRVLELESKQ